MQTATQRRYRATSALGILIFALAAGSSFQLSAADLSAEELPTPPSSSSGWVLADLNGDQTVDLATAQSGLHDSNGYAQEVRVELGASKPTFFRFLSQAAIVELSSQDVDGDDDGDLVVFEPLSSQPIGVWLNDGRGSFHEGRLADFRKLWSERPSPTLRARIAEPPLLAISEERTQFLAPAVAIAAPEPVVAGRTWQDESSLPDAGSSDFRPRGPPRGF